MEDDEFEWDDDKAASNLAKHDMSFDLATAVFDDPLAMDRDDPTSATEDRYNIVGEVGGRLLHVTYTYRRRRIRIISVRKATRYERKSYSRGHF